MKRKLAAILVADVVGYSRLMGEDQQRTLAALQQLRDALFDPHVAANGGNIAKRMGDGWIVEFASVADAVDCALSIQSGLAGHDIIRLRMGIHIGDVVRQNDDIFGDGVNVAARLEALAAPGEILLSDTAYHSLDGKAAEQFRGGDSHQLKNIARAVQVWRWPDRGAAAAASSIITDVLTLPDKPSIAVLPFNNMSGDAEQEYFVDGMTEDIITDLSKASNLFVIARNSSFAFKGKSPDIRDVCRQLGVRHVLEGSVRRSGNRVRINAQLIDGDNGSHLWADRYDRDMEDIFAVQDEVTREIVGALKVELTPKEEKHREKLGKANPEAMDYLYRGWNCLFQFSPEALVEGRRLFEKAAEIDENLATAYAYQALTYMTDYLNNWNASSQDNLRKALELGKKACRIDNGNVFGHVASSLALAFLGELDNAEAIAKKAVELGPNIPNSYSALGQIVDFKGEHQQALDLFSAGYRLDPQYDMLLHLMGRAQMALGQVVEAEASFRRRLIHNPRSDFTMAYLAALLGGQGRIEEAQALWQKLTDVNPDFNPYHTQKTLPFVDNTWFDKYFGGLEKAGLLTPQMKEQS